MSIELKTASGGSVTLVPEDGVSNVTATVKHESGVLASEFDAGVGRTWQDVTASRSSGVTYTNDTGREIELYFRATANTSTSVTVDGLTFFGPVTASGIGTPMSLTIPEGSTYSLNITSGSITIWMELR